MSSLITDEANVKLLSHIVSTPLFVDITAHLLSLLSKALKVGNLDLLFSNRVHNTLTLLWLTSVNTKAGSFVCLSNAASNSIHSLLELSVLPNYNFYLFMILTDYFC